MQACGPTAVAGTVETALCGGLLLGGHASGRAETREGRKAGNMVLFTATWYYENVMTTLTVKIPEALGAQYCHRCPPRTRDEVGIGPARNGEICRTNWRRP